MTTTFIMPVPGMQDTGKRHAVTAPWNGETIGIFDEVRIVKFNMTFTAEFTQLMPLDQTVLAVIPDENDDRSADA